MLFRSVRTHRGSGAYVPVLREGCGGQPERQAAAEGVGVGAELVHGADRGARINLRDIPSEEPGMSPAQVWCNEAQERYVLAVPANRLETFAALCVRERCPFAVVGVTTAERELVLEDGEGGERPIDMPMDVLLGKPPKMQRDVQRVARPVAPLIGITGIFIFTV